MKTEPTRIVDAWESRVSDFTAHRKTDDINLIKRNLVKTFKAACFKLNLIGSNVLDYGCGGGYLGEYLLSRGISKYNGVDISKKSIAAAMQNLKKYSRDCSFFLIAPGDFLNIEPLRIDIIFCLSVIQHFPDREYFNSFFKFLNSCNVKILSLQIKYAEKTTFQDRPYKTTFEIGNACFTNEGDISAMLPGYFLYEKVGEDIPGKYQYLLFLKKENKK